MVRNHCVSLLCTQYGKWCLWLIFVDCHCQVIPLESTMKRPKNMPVVLDLAALTVVGINLPFALYGYLMFGSMTNGR